MYTSDWHDVPAGISHPINQILWRTPEDNPTSTTKGDIIYKHENGNHRLCINVTKQEFETLLKAPKQQATNTRVFERVLGRPTETADKTLETDVDESIITQATVTGPADLDITQQTNRDLKRWRKTMEIDYKIDMVDKKTLDTAIVLTAMENEDDFLAIVDQLRND